MSGPITRAQYIKDLKELLSALETEDDLPPFVDEEFRKDIERKLAFALEHKSFRPPPQPCGLPEVWERNHPITGRKAKPKEE